MALNSYALTTVANVKTFLGISVSTYDTLIEDLIDGCTDWIEKYCGGRRFFNDGSTAVTTYFDGGEVDRLKMRLFLPNFPILAITSVSYRSGTYDSPTWNAYSASSDYIRKDTTGELYFPGGLPSGVQNIRVVYRGGYTTLPDDLIVACTRIVAKVFGKRKAQGVLNESIGGGSLAWNESMDPEVKSILDSYRSHYF